MKTEDMNSDMWQQFWRFCAVGAVGFAINLAVYAGLLHGLGLHYLIAAVGAFLVAVGSNYALNRAWTFQAARGPVAAQGARFLVVSVAALGANLLVLHVLVALSLGEVPAQAIAIITVTPVNFLGNKLWSFRPATRRPPP